MERNALLVFLYGNVLPFRCTHLYFCLYVLGAFCKWLPDEDLSNIIDDVLLNSAGNDSDWQIKHGRTTALYVAMKGMISKTCMKFSKLVNIYLTCPSRCY